MRSYPGSGSARELSRRALIAAAGAVCVPAVMTRGARAAEFSFKMSHGNEPSNPFHVRALEAAARIREETCGRVEVNVFPSYQLGSDTDTLSQVRSGAIEMLSMSASIVATLVPLSSIVNTGFAFSSHDKVWQALDGPLGTHVRQAIARSGLVVFDRIWDNGFRQISTLARPVRQPDDLRGLKLRVPPSRMLTSLFQSLGAAPTPINFSELYAALQTRVVDGQENALQAVWTTRLFEVQKYVAMTNHVWDGYWILGNRRAFQSLPEDLRRVVQTEFDRSAIAQRADYQGLGREARAKMTAAGLQFTDPDVDAFRTRLKGTDFYKEWRSRFGEEAWGLLTNSVGEF